MQIEATCWGKPPGRPDAQAEKKHGPTKPDKYPQRKQFIFQGEDDRGPAQALARALFRFATWAAKQPVSWWREVTKINVHVRW